MSRLQSPKAVPLASVEKNWRLRPRQAKKSSPSGAKGTKEPNGDGLMLDGLAAELDAAAVVRHS